VAYARVNAIAERALDELLTTPSADRRGHASRDQASDRSS
jgi:hypothetical protein